MIPDSRSILSTAPGTTPFRLSRSPAPSRAPVKPATSTTTVERVTQSSKEAQARSKPLEVFACDEESQFYSQCLEKLLIKNSSDTQTVIEFGSGDGVPVISCLFNSQFEGTIHGFELNPKAATLAKDKAAEMLLSQQYQVHNSCFFKGCKDVPATCLIANPPYIAAPDNDILMPALHGGVDGANLTRDLLSLGFDSCILLISAYANPVETIEHARMQGYQVTDFMVTPMPFGYYSSEPKVKNWIWKMRSEGKAFCSDNWYLLAGVLFQKCSTPVNGAVSHKRKSDHNGSAGGSADVAMQNNILATNAALRHRYAQNINGTVNHGEDQTDELLKVMTALR